MTSRIAFYAPLKSPKHPIPSGDREIARNLIKALQLCGYDTSVASEIISYQKRPSSDQFGERRVACEAEAARLVSVWRNAREAAPNLWLTYHPYCKSPDWIGPAVAGALGIPYVTVEACRTHQNTDADWAGGRAVVQAAVHDAALNFCLKPSDNTYLSSFLPNMKKVTPLLPFIDEGASPHSSGNAALPFGSDAPVMLAVGMMRPGAKTRSYRMLAEALAGMEDTGWNLMIVGDGPERASVEALFSGFASDRICFTGAITREKVHDYMGSADIFVWPGLGEAFGVAYLEAQAAGLPVVACATAGVPIVVAHEVSGLLTPADDADLFRASLRRLLGSPAARKSLGEGGRRKVAAQHSLTAAAATLKAGIDPLLEASSAVPEEKHRPA